MRSGRTSTGYWPIDVGSGPSVICTPLFLNRLAMGANLTYVSSQQSRRASVARHAISRRVFSFRLWRADSAKLEMAIQANLRGLGYGG